MHVIVLSWRLNARGVQRDSFDCLKKKQVTTVTHGVFLNVVAVYSAQKLLLHFLSVKVKWLFNKDVNVKLQINRILLVSVSLER